MRRLRESSGLSLLLETKVNLFGVLGWQSGIIFVTVKLLAYYCGQGRMINVCSVHTWKDKCILMVRNIPVSQ